LTLNLTFHRGDAEGCVPAVSFLDSCKKRSYSRKDAKRAKKNKLLHPATNPPLE